MRKTALLTGVAGLFLLTAPAMAQEAMAPQTPPAPAEAAAQPTEEPATLTLQPGTDVTGSDGMVLGQLEGARNTEAGQELTVRGPDGQLRGVPVAAGVRQEGAGVAVGWTSAQFEAAPAITADEAAPVAGPNPPLPDPQVMAPATPPTLPAEQDAADPIPDEARPPVPQP
jgi:hypothetical protein